jgi:hypothetical protein
MDQIYATSYLTVSLSTSSDANSGFLQQRNQLGLQSCLQLALLVGQPDLCWHPPEEASAVAFLAKFPLHAAFWTIEAGFFRSESWPEDSYTGACKKYRGNAKVSMRPSASPMVKFTGITDLGGLPTATVPARAMLRLTIPDLYAGSVWSYEPQMIQNRRLLRTKRTKEACGTPLSKSSQDGD